MKSLEFSEIIDVIRTDDWAGMKKHIDSSNQIYVKLLLFTGVACCLITVLCLVAFIGVLGFLVFSLIFLGDSLGWGDLLRYAIALLLLLVLMLVTVEMPGEIAREINNLFRLTLAAARRKKDARESQEP